MSVPSMVLRNGTEIPMVGLGTWRSPPDVMTEVVKDAIELGYRHIDCAFIYGNEREVGIALQEQIKKGIVERKEIFVTSKLWNTYHHPDMVEDALRRTLDNLRLEYLDLYLIHWPTAFKDGHDLYPRDEAGKFIYSDTDYVDTWRAMEDLVIAGLCRAIGLSNFNKRQILRILEVARIPPDVVQIECHPYLNQKRLIAFCREKCIAVIAYSPLGSGHTPYAKCSNHPLLQQPKIAEIAERHNRTVAQILIRFQTQRGNIVIPRSITKSHMESNLKVFDFSLDEQEMSELNALDMNGRFLTMTAYSGHPHHPFENDEF